MNKEGNVTDSKPAIATVEKAADPKDLLVNTTFEYPAADEEGST